MTRYLPSFVFTLSLAAQPAFRVPAEVRQGDTLHIDVSGLAPASGLTVSFLDKTVPLYESGLAAVPALQPPGEFPLTVKDTTGAELHHAVVRVLDAGFATQNIERTSRMKALKPSSGENETARAFLQTESPERLWTEPFQRPVPGCANSPFGVQRLHDGKPSGNYHRGLDLRAPQGRPVRAAAAGIVKISRMWSARGGTVGIDHGQGVLTLYFHQSRVVAKEGRAVRRGEIIGYVGATGFATGPHLHFQVHIHGEPVNPNQWAPGIPPCP